MYDARNCQGRRDPARVPGAPVEARRPDNFEGEGAGAERRSTGVGFLGLAEVSGVGCGRK